MLKMKKKEKTIDAVWDNVYGIDAVPRGVYGWDFCNFFFVVYFCKKEMKVV